MTHEIIPKVSEIETSKLHMNYSGVLFFCSSVNNLTRFYQTIQDE
jgi:hypothetical protein